jgi:GTP-binding protein
VEIKEAVFLKSSPSIKECPNPDRPEFAFIGRSNVGKSSLINMLCNRKKLAKTSSTPGKTQLINHFTINEQWYLVDLPGYGFAKVSKKQRESFNKMIHGYILNRKNLLNTFVLVDSRIPAQKIDLEFIQTLGENGIPLSIVFTKADKSKTTQLQKNLAAYKKELKKHWEDLPPLFLTSAETKAGQEELLGYIDALIPLF